jgi:hypothetical protein
MSLRDAKSNDEISYGIQLTALERISRKWHLGRCKGRNEPDDSNSKSQRAELNEILDSPSYTPRSLTFGRGSQK